ncbi:MAG: hypothetical protein ACREOE_06310, partial [Gemmatimonadales bacterium]
ASRSELVAAHMADLAAQYPAAWGRVTQESTDKTLTKAAAAVRAEVEVTDHPGGGDLVELQAGAGQESALRPFQSHSVS